MTFSVGDALEQVRILAEDARQWERLNDREGDIDRGNGTAYYRGKAEALEHVLGLFAAAGEEPEASPDPVVAWRSEVAGALGSAFSGNLVAVGIELALKRIDITAERIEAMVRMRRGGGP